MAKPVPGSGYPWITQSESDVNAQLAYAHTAPATIVPLLQPVDIPLSPGYRTAADMVRKSRAIDVVTSFQDNANGAVSSDGICKKYNINLRDDNPFPQIPAAPGIPNFDQSTIDIAAMGAFYARDRLRDLAPVLPLAADGNPVPFAYKRTVGTLALADDGGWAGLPPPAEPGDYQVVRYLNADTNAAKERVPQQITLIFHAPIGATYNYVGHGGGAHGGAHGYVGGYARGHPIVGHPRQRDAYHTNRASVMLHRNFRTTHSACYRDMYLEARNALHAAASTPSAAGQFVVGRIEVLTVELAAGACLSSKQRTMIFDGVHVWSPQSSGNNCLLACLRLGRKLFLDKKMGNLVLEGVETEMQQSANLFKNGKGEFAKIRSLLGWNTNAPIDCTDEKGMIYLAELYSMAFVVYENSIIAENEICNVGPGFRTLQVQILLKDGHYTLVKYQQPSPWLRCNLCGVEYHKIHNCNINRMQFVRNKKNRERMAARGITLPGCGKNVVYEESIPDKTIPIGTIDYDLDFIYFDFETFSKIDEEMAAKVYASGHLFQGTYEKYYGETALDQFLDFLTTLKNRVVYTDGQKPFKVPIFIIAWNGAKFDFKIILRYILQDVALREVIQVTNPVVNNNRIISCTLNIGEIFIRFWDPILFLVGTSLDKACSDFKVSSDNHKAVFPHPLITGYDGANLWVTLEQLNDPANYFAGNVKSLLKNPYTEESLDFARAAKMEGEWKYSLQDISEWYLEKDVRGMAEIIKSFAGTMDALFSCTLPYYVTISQFSAAQWWSKSEFKAHIHLPANPLEYEAMKGAVYGGRVEPIKSLYCSPKLDFEKLIDGLEAEQVDDGYIFKNHGLEYKDFEKDSIRELDYTSLYPSAMVRFTFPIGTPTHLDDVAIADLNDAASLDNPVILLQNLREGIYHVSYLPNRHLPFGILPQRKLLGISWDVLPGEGWYTSVDLEMAIKCHYKITFKSGMVWTRQEFIFRDFINMAYKIKQDGSDEGNSAKRQAGKIMLNSLYGKMLQSIISDVFSFCYSKEEVRKFCNEYGMTGMMMFTDELVGMSGIKPEITYRKPYHLGAFILSKARFLMFEQMVILNPMILRSPEQLNKSCMGYMLDKNFFYTDTDSMWIESYLVSRFTDLGGNLGQLKDESIGGGLVISAWYVSKKVYCVIYINKDNKVWAAMKCKGILQRELQLSDFLNAIYSKKSRSMVIEDCLKTYNVNSYEDFMNVKSVSLKRTFYKTPFDGRVKVNSELKADEFGEWSLPLGHILLD